MCYVGVPHPFVSEKGLSSTLHRAQGRMIILSGMCVPLQIEKCACGGVPLVLFLGTGGSASSDSNGDRS